MFVQVVSFKPPFFFSPILGMLMHHHELEFDAKRLFAVFKVKVTARAHDQKMTVFTISAELLILLQPDLV